MTTAAHDRTAILDRVAAAIWNAPAAQHLLNWERAKVAAAANRHPQIAYQVETTVREARAAIGALMIGVAPRQEDVRLCMAGEHATGIVGGLCAEAFDAMLAEVLA